MTVQVIICMIMMIYGDNVTKGKKITFGTEKIVQISFVNMKQKQVIWFCNMLA